MLHFIGMIYLSKHIITSIFFLGESSNYNPLKMFQSKKGLSPIAYIVQRNLSSCYCMFCVVKCKSAMLYINNCPLLDTQSICCPMINVWLGSSGKGEGMKLIWFHVAVWITFVWWNISVDINSHKSVGN